MSREGFADLFEQGEACFADHYINFKDLITELYRIYKTRIWLSAINPASFSQHALASLPSGIGLGALSNQDHMDPLAL
jgi:hypothetical protein